MFKSKIYNTDGVMGNKMEENEKFVPKKKKRNLEIIVSIDQLNR